MNEQKLLEGLRELSKTAFPRKCMNCGRVYASLEEFIKETKQLERGSGLIENVGCPEDGDEPIVELYRNCVCGSTLMEFFADRRDSSENGQRRRDVFGKLLYLMNEKGISNEDARKELLLLLQFKRSKLIEKMGIQLNLLNLSDVDKSEVEDSRDLESWSGLPQEHLPPSGEGRDEADIKSKGDDQT
jgi:hypothetical protein